jgi:hypothetical protein
MVFYGYRRARRLVHRQAHVYLIFITHFWIVSDVGFNKHAQLRFILFAGSIF